MRRLLSAGLLAAAVAVLSNPALAQLKPPVPGPSISGAWTRNKDLSDAPTGRGQEGDDSGRGRGNGGGGGGGGRHGGGGGGYGGGYGRGGGMGRGGGDAAGRVNPDEMMRMQNAMRDVTNPSEHLIVTQTESMVSTIPATPGSVNVAFSMHITPRISTRLISTAMNATTPAT